MRNSYLELPEDYQIVTCKVNFNGVTAVQGHSELLNNLGIQEKLKFAGDGYYTFLEAGGKLHVINVQHYDLNYECIQEERLKYTKWVTEANIMIPKHNEPGIPGNMLCINLDTQFQYPMHNISFNNNERFQIFRIQPDSIIYENEESNVIAGIGFDDIDVDLNFLYTDKLECMDDYYGLEADVFIDTVRGTKVILGIKY